MMKRSLAIVTLVILALAVPASMLAQQNSKAEKKVRAVIDELKQAQLKGGAEGAAILEKYFADDYVRIFTDGRVFNKAETLGSFRTGKTKYESFEYSDLKIRIYGHTALATAIVKTTGTTYGGSTSPTGVRWTQVFVKRTGKWQPVLTQTTRLAS
jgi:ketosteroid isomerase-like protein